MKKVLILFILLTLFSCGEDGNSEEDKGGCIENNNCLEDQYCNQSYNICVPNYCITENIDCGEGSCEPDDRYGSICVCDENSVLKNGVCVSTVCETFNDCKKFEDKPFCEEGYCSTNCLTSGTSCPEGFQCNSEENGCIEMEVITDEEICIQNGFDYLDYKGECRRFCDKNSNPCGEYEGCIDQRCAKRCYEDQHCEQYGQRCIMGVGGLCLNDVCKIGCEECYYRDEVTPYCVNEEKSVSEFIDFMIDYANVRSDNDIECEHLKYLDYSCSDQTGDVDVSIIEVPGSNHCRTKFEITRENYIDGEIKESERGSWWYEYGKVVIRVFEGVIWYYFPNIEIREPLNIEAIEDLTGDSPIIKQLKVTYQQEWGGIPILGHYISIDTSSTLEINSIKGCYNNSLPFKPYQTDLIREINETELEIRDKLYTHYISIGRENISITSGYKYMYGEDDQFNIYIGFSIYSGTENIECFNIKYDNYDENLSISDIINQGGCISGLHND